jgi:hypothetical protein
MLTYVAVLLLVLAVLYGSFRVLGGGDDPVAVETYRELLGRLRELAVERAAELSGALERSRLLAHPTAATPAPRVDPLVETAAEARRKLTGYRHQLERVEVAATGEELDGLLSARTLLAAAIEDHAWACRLLEGGSHRENPGIQDAVAALRAHGGRCLEAVDDLLAGRPVAGVQPGGR